jgi:hypothetical protein
MNGNTANRRNLSESEREAFKKALVLYYTGTSPIRAAFDQVEPGLVDRYYRRKKKYLEEIDEINVEARHIALQKRSAAQLAFESRQEAFSMELQRAAAAMLEGALPGLADIAEGKPYTVYDEAIGQEKVIIPYPRDQIAAFNTLRTLAREGLLPQNMVTRRGSSAEQGETDKGQLLPLIGVATDFRRITAQRADGTTLTATVEHPDVIDAEVDEHDE